MSVGYASGDCALFVCMRCQRELPYKESYADPDKGPSVRVCWADRDARDPWKLPPRQMECISLEYPRPDVTLTDQTPSVWDTDGAIYDNDVDYNWDGPAPQ